MIAKCKFSTRKVELSLFNFISHRLNDPPFKLRLINNDYYRFGFDDGIAICFDQSERILEIKAR